MGRISKTFKRLKASRKKAFIAFITAGYPNLSDTKKLVLEFHRIGVDIVELGVPFSDPMADGPVIQEASQESLKKGTTLRKIIRLVKEIRKTSDIPICLMTYYNPIFAIGEEEFVRLAAHAGVDGVIVPDLPPEEGVSLRALCDHRGIDVIAFVAPTTSPERVQFISRIARGFIYYVSLTGVTGARKKLPADMVNNLKALKRLTSLPVCVGFGVSTPAQVAKVKRISDGVIVGSAIVKTIQSNRTRPDLIQKVSARVKELNV